MIVTLSAGHGQAQKSARGGIHTVVLHLRAQGIKSQTGFVSFLIGKLIAGVFDLSATLLIETRTLPSGKYVAAQPRAIGYGATWKCRA